MPAGGGITPTDEGPFGSIILSSVVVFDHRERRKACPSHCQTDTECKDGDWEMMPVFNLRISTRYLIPRLLLIILVASFSGGTSTRHAVPYKNTRTPLRRTTSVLQCFPYKGFLPPGPFFVVTISDRRGGLVSIEEAPFAG
jgi:hypothetical protein